MYKYIYIEQKARHKVCGGGGVRQKAHRYEKAIPSLLLG